MSDDTHDNPWGQAGYHCRLEWGRRGAQAAADRGDLLIVADVLSFSTVAVTAIAQGAPAISRGGDSSESGAYGKQFADPGQQRDPSLLSTAEGGGAVRAWSVLGEGVRRRRGEDRSPRPICQRPHGVGVGVGGAVGAAVEVALAPGVEVATGVAVAFGPGVMVAVGDADVTAGPDVGVAVAIWVAVAAGASLFGATAPLPQALMQ